MAHRITSWAGGSLLVLVTLACGGENAQNANLRADGGSGGAATGDASSGTTGGGPGTGGGHAGGTANAGGAAGGGATGEGGAAAGGPDASGGSVGLAGAMNGGSGGAATGGAPGSGGASGSGGTSGTGGAPGTPSQGCGSAAPDNAPEWVEVPSQGRRTFVMDLPSGYDPTRPTPIVFAFHGMTTSGRQFRSEWYGNLGSTLGQEFIVVYPDAQGTPTAWDNPRDVPFFDALLEELAARYCVDMSRVFATGHSSGGFFSNTLGCERGDVLRAIAPVSGGGPSRRSCVGEVAVLLIHGTNDTVVLPSVGERSRDRWVEENGCDAEQIRDVSEAYPCREYSECEPGLPVRWCTHTEGHDWASFAPRAIHDFFRAF